MAPVEQTAAVTSGTHDGEVELKKILVPKPGENQVLVRVVAAAFNPIDRRFVTTKFAGTVPGFDLAGVIEELGPGTEGFRKVGERVAAGVIGGSPASPNGAFSEYVVVKADLCLSLPDDWSFENASQLTGATVTATQALAQSLRFPLFPARAVSEPTPILVYGASSSVGCFTVQFAKLGGFKVYAVCSPKNFELVKGLGADEVFDYHDPEAAKKIKEETGGRLQYAVDAISEHASWNFITDTFSDKGGKIAIVRTYESPRANIEAIYSSAAGFYVDPEALGLPNAGPSRIPEGPKYAKAVTEALAQGKLKPAPVLILPKGLASVRDGLTLFKEGKVSGQKIVLRISDTPGLQ